MIYFNEQLQNRVHKLLYSSLRRYGVLGLGRKESLRGTPHETTTRSSTRTSASSADPNDAGGGAEGGGGRDVARRHARARDRAARIGARLSAAHRGRAASQRRVGRAAVAADAPSAAAFARCRIVEASDKDPLDGGRVFLAPPDYHLLIDDGCFALSIDPRVCHARPSIDVLFESAADVYREGVLAVLMTGASADGTMGAMRIKRRGGRVVAQDPRTAESAVMPQAAINAGVVDQVLPLDEIAPYLNVAVVAHR